MANNSYAKQRKERYCYSGVVTPAMKEVEDTVRKYLERTDSVPVQITPEIISREEYESNKVVVPGKEILDFVVIFKIIDPDTQRRHLLDMDALNYLNETFTKWPAKTADDLFREMMLSFDFVKTGSSYIVTNGDKQFGASSILWTDLSGKSLLANISNAEDSDLYVLPVSKHKMVVVPESKIVNNYKLIELINTIYNLTPVKDRLLDSLYKYNRKDCMMNLIHSEYKRCYEFGVNGPVYKYPCSESYLWKF